MEGIRLGAALEKLNEIPVYKLDQTEICSKGYLDEPCKPVNILFYLALLSRDTCNGNDVHVSVYRVLASLMCLFYTWNISEKERSNYGSSEKRYYLLAQHYDMYS
jgi:hypothetical protein